MDKDTKKRLLKLDDEIINHETILSNLRDEYDELLQEKRLIEKLMSDK